VAVTVLPSFETTDRPVTLYFPPFFFCVKVSVFAFTCLIAIVSGAGFGSVIPNTPAGQIAQGSTMLATSFQIRFGTTLASVTYAGLAPGETGVYQFDVTVPSVPSNDAEPLTFMLGGVTGTQTLCIAVQD